MYFSTRLSEYRVSTGRKVSGSGLQKGDRIVSLNGTPVATFTGLVTRLSECNGDSVKVVVERNGEELSLPLALNAEKKIMVEF